MGFVTNIEKATLENNVFRRVVYTSHHLQLVVMSIPIGKDIGVETHEAVDQFIRIEKGTAEAVLGGTSSALTEGSVIIIPAGEEHNIINTGGEPLQLYSIYTPPHHRDGVVHTTKEEAYKDDEHFDGAVTSM